MVSCRSLGFLKAPLKMWVCFGGFPRLVGTVLVLLKGLGYWFGGLVLFG